MPRRGCTRRSSLLEGFRDSQKQLVAVRELEDEGDRLNREASPSSSAPVRTR